MNKSKCTCCVPVLERQMFFSLISDFLLTVKCVSLTIVLSLIRCCEFTPLLAYAHESGLRNLSDHRRQMFFGALLRRTALLLSILRLTEMMVPHLITCIFNNVTYEWPKQKNFLFLYSHLHFVVRICIWVVATLLLT